MTLEEIFHKVKIFKLSHEDMYKQIVILITKIILPLAEATMCLLIPQTKYNPGPVLSPDARKDASYSRLLIPPTLVQQTCNLIQVYTIHTLCSIP